MQVNIHFPDVGVNHGSIDVVDPFVIGISFLTSEFWRPIAWPIAGAMR